MRVILKSIICSFYGILLLTAYNAEGQSRNTYWQQKADYTMDIVVDVEANSFTGHQTIRYRNNSPETLEKVFFHLYLNAFQPGSVMDIRARATGQPDPRMGPIWDLKEDEIGYQKIKKLTQNGRKLKFEVVGTILEVQLASPIKPGQTTTFEMDYEAGIPAMVRRSGRDNKEGVRYSMGQWYPKLCAYDRKGWHADPYVGREFYGVFGNYDVRITIDSSFTVAATGQLKNATEIGHGYAPAPKEKQSQLTWHFVAEKVHDFVWAADPRYTHEVHKCANGVEFHAFYLAGKTYEDAWNAFLPIMEQALDYANLHFGTYPYPVYSFIQAGDGGMEYAMATMITGNRPLTSLVGVSVHEMMHSWYQMVLGFNESYYYWMDEGFVQYAAERVMDHLQTLELLTGYPDEFPYETFYRDYVKLVSSGIEEPLSTHADHFNSYSLYSISAYEKGAIFLNQLEYIIGKPAFDQGLLDFFTKWKFKHPDDVDFTRVIELVSDLELDWYRDYWVNSTKSIDYGIDTVYGNSLESIIYLTREGGMPMPIDVVVEFDDGDKLFCTIPLDIMRGHKTEVAPNGNPFLALPPWDWVHPYYYFTVPFAIQKIKTIAIDPSRRLADIDERNNVWPFTSADPSKQD